MNTGVRFWDNLVQMRTREETALMTIEANFLVLPFHPRQCESFNVTRYFECRERLTLKPTVRVFLWLNDLMEHAARPLVFLDEQLAFEQESE